MIDLNDSQHATVLAALRYYQANGQGDPLNRRLDIHDIATNGDTVISLDADGIDDLCEQINADGHVADPPVSVAQQRLIDDAAKARGLNLTGETDAMIEARAFHGERIEARRRLNTPWDHDGLAYYVSN